MTPQIFICKNISSLILDDPKAALEIKSIIKQQKINWKSVISLASGWLVLPTLYDSLEKLKLWDDIPNDIYLYFKTVHDLSRERAHTTKKDIKKIYSILAQNNIPVVAIKGVAYHVNLLYNNITFRIESDIDILIPDNFLTLSYDLLKQNNFSSPNNYEEEWEKLPSSHHLPPLLNQTGTEVEIHQALYPKRIVALLTSSEVWDQSIPHPKFPHSPSPTHLIMLILIHGMLGDGLYCKHLFNLRMAQDTILICHQYENEIDWEFILKRFKAAHLQHIPAAHFHSIEYFLGMPCPKVFNKNWKSLLFIQRIRFNHWFSHTVPYLPQLFFIFRQRYCHEKNIIGAFIRGYWIRLKNKMIRIFF